MYCHLPTTNGNRCLWPVVVKMDCQIEGNKQEKELLRCPLLPICLTMEELEIFVFEERTSQTAPQVSGTQAIEQRPSLAHSIPTNEEVLCLTIPHSNDKGLGLGTTGPHPRQGQDGCYEAQPYETGLWGGGGRSITAEGLADSVRWIP